MKQNWSQHVDAIRNWVAKWQYLAPHVKTGTIQQSLGHSYAWWRNEQTAGEQQKRISEIRIEIYQLSKSTDEEIKVYPTKTKLIEDAGAVRYVLENKQLATHQKE